MIGSSPTSLGIDISDTQISIALVGKAKGGYKLLKADSVAVPAGSVEDGNITDVALLSKAIKGLLSKNKIRNRKAVVSLIAKPILSRIVDLPDGSPANMHKFVQSEIRHSPALAGKTPQYDYCGLGGISHDGPSRIFIGATDSEKISRLREVFKLAGVELVSIDFAFIAWLGALYQKHIATHFDKHVLLSYLHGSTLTICVFVKGVLQFVRSIDTAEKCERESCQVCFESEINAVMQYFELELGDTDCDWAVISRCDRSVEFCEQTSGLLENKLSCSVSIASDHDVYENTTVRKNEAIEKASITAIGLAITQFASSGVGLSIDLMPPEAEEIKVTRKYAARTIQAAAAVLLVMFGMGYLLDHQISTTKAAMKKENPDDSASTIELMLKDQNRIGTSIENLLEKKDSMEKVFHDTKAYDWALILDDIRHRIPESLCTTSLIFQEGSTLQVTGNALSFKSIHTFAKQLHDSEYFDSASVTETNKNSSTAGIVGYSIECKLANNESETDAD